MDTTMDSLAARLEILEKQMALVLATHNDKSNTRDALTITSQLGAPGKDKIVHRAVDNQGRAWAVAK